MASQPPRCPTPACDSVRSPDGTWFTQRGTFPRADGRLVRRFQCKSCGRHFSEQTFRLDYRQKLPRINLPLRELLAAGTSFRAAARLLGVNRKTVRRRAWPPRRGRGGPSAAPAEDTDGAESTATMPKRGA